MNTFGRVFRITTWGESHGKALGCVIDGCPSGIPLDEAGINSDLERRKPGQSKVTTQRKEQDKSEILSGVFEGVTTGHPISVIVFNNDADSQAYETLENVFRPGHADKTYFEKYGVQDFRGGGRASGRETIGRVIGGAVAKRVLSQQDIRIFGYAMQIGNIQAKQVDVSYIEKNIVRTADPNVANAMVEEIEKARKDGDSIGGIVEITVQNCPKGLGSPVFGKLKADLTAALMSIGAVVGVEYGLGFAGAMKRGSEFNDQLNEKGFITNHHGGMLGGISTGEEIVLRIAVKPTPSISKEQKTLTKDNKEAIISITGRHDPCLVPRIIPVATAMVALVLADHYLLHTMYGVPLITQS
jgi:chorismate synthase